LGDHVLGHARGRSPTSDGRDDAVPSDPGGIHNIRKHAETTKVLVHLNRFQEVIHLSIRDWGKGFEVGAIKPEAGEHIGLLGMRERVALANGRFALDSHPGAGTQIVAEVPLNSPAGSMIAGPFTDT
jgi:signal transduction histidine kinase